MGFLREKFIHLSKRIILDPKVTFKAQLLLWFNLTIVVGLGLTIGICLGLCISFGQSLIDFVTKYSLNLSARSALLAARFLSSIIYSEIRLMTICLSWSATLYTSGLLKSNLVRTGNNTGYHSSNWSTIIQKQAIFRDYNFVNNCQYPLCPHDFGFQKLYRFQNSPKYSSFYLYSESSNVVTDDSHWDQLITKYPMIEAIINSMSILQEDFYLSRIIRKEFDAIFLTVKVQFDDDYVVIHMTNPGMKLSPSFGDPSSYAWFTEAPTYQYYLEGPSFDPTVSTQQLKASTRAVQSLFDYDTNTNIQIDIVSTVMLDWSDVVASVSLIVPPSEGYTGMLQYSNLETLFWYNTSADDLIDHSTNRFRNVTDFDSYLAMNTNLRTNGTKDYLDKHSRHVMAGYYPFCPFSAYTSGVDYAYKFTIILFVYLALIDEVLTQAHSNLSQSLYVIILVAMFLGISVIIINNAVAFTFSTWLTKPLKSIRLLADEVVEITFTYSDTGMSRDYSNIINSELLLTDRTDEIGALLTSFKDMITTLNNECKRRLNGDDRSRNPFYLSTIHPQVFSWREFCTRGLAAYNAEKAAEEVVAGGIQSLSRRRAGASPMSEKGSSPPTAHSPSMSLGETLKSRIKFPFEKRSQDSLSNTGNISGENILGTKSQKIASISPRDSHRMSRVSMMRSAMSSSADTQTTSKSRTESQRVRFKASLKLYWLLLCLLLVSTLVPLVVYVSNNSTFFGQSLIRKEDSTVYGYYIDQIETLLSAKLILFENVLDPLNLALNTSVAYTSNLVNGYYTESNLTEQKFLESYSLDSSNPFSLKGSNTSFDFSGYFYKVFIYLFIDNYLFNIAIKDLFIAIIFYYYIIIIFTCYV